MKIEKFLVQHPKNLVILFFDVIRCHNNDYTIKSRAING